MVARRFPFSVGRISSCELCLDDPGVWDKHFQINLNSADGFVLVAEPDSPVIVEGKTVEQTLLRNGDTIEIGLAKILFALSPVLQKSLALREWLTWIGLTVICLVEVALIYKLIR